MALFPESSRRKPLFGYDNTPDENVKRTPPEAGDSYIRDVWGTLRFVARMDFQLSKADAGVLWAFYEANRLTGFTFFDFAMVYAWAKTIGTGDGVTAAFTIPGKETVLTTVTVGGVAKALGVDYTFSAGTGADGQDRIIFIAGHIPAAAAAVAIVADTRRKYTVEFAEKPSRRSMNFNTVMISMRVQEKFPLAA